MDESNVTNIVFLFVCKLIFMTGSVVTLQTLTFHIDANMKGCSIKILCFPAPWLKVGPPPATLCNIKPAMDKLIVSGGLSYEFARCEKTRYNWSIPLLVSTTSTVIATVNPLIAVEINTHLKLCLA